MIEIVLREESSIQIATLSGEIDGHTAGQVQEALLPLFETAPSIVMDMTDVTFMSSAGLRTLLLLYRQAEAKNGRVVLVGLSEQIADTMSITGFLGFFTVCNSLADALATLGAA